MDLISRVFDLSYLLASQSNQTILLVLVTIDRYRYLGADPEARFVESSKAPPYVFHDTTLLQLSASKVQRRDIDKGMARLCSIGTHTKPDCGSSNNFLSASNSVYFVNRVTIV